MIPLLEPGADLELLLGALGPKSMLSLKSALESMPEKET